MSRGSLPKRSVSGFKVLHPFGCHRDIVALVRAELLEDLRVVIAVAARMELHDQAILDAHAGHLDRHVAREPPDILGCCLARRGRGRRSPRPRRRRRASVYGVSTPLSVEVAPMLLKKARRSSSAAMRPCAVVISRPTTALERFQVRAPGRQPEIGHGVRAERRPHDPGPTRILDRLVILERIRGAVGGAQDLDLEAVEQRARAVLRAWPAWLPARRRSPARWRRSASAGCRRPRRARAPATMPLGVPRKR